MLPDVLLWESTASADTSMSGVGGIGLQQGRALFGGGDLFGRIHQGNLPSGYSSSGRYDSPSPDFWPDRLDDVAATPASTPPALPIPDGECQSTFDPPTWAEDCPLPSSSECAAPCLLEQPDGCDPDRLPVDEASDAFDWTWAVQDPSEPVDYDVIDAITSAWAVLIDNIDIVEWVCCLAYGEGTSPSNPLEWLGGLVGIPVSLADCVVQKVLGKQARVTLKLNDAEIDQFRGNTGSGISGGYIRVPAGGALKQRYMKFLDSSDPFYSQPEQRFCILADLAATLLHQLVHTCVTGGKADEPDGGIDRSGQCSTSYLIENGFRWAIGARFPCLSQTACWYYSCDDTWMSDRTSYPWDPVCPQGGWASRDLSIARSWGPSHRKRAWIAAAAPR